MYSEQCKLYSVHNTVENVQCTMYGLQFTLCNVQCIVYCEENTVLSIQCRVHRLGIIREGAALHETSNRVNNLNQVQPQATEF